MTTRRRTATLVALWSAVLALAGVATLPSVANRLLSDHRLVRGLRAKWRGAEYVGDSGVIHQRRTNDCGASCLKMVFAVHGVERDLTRLEAELQIGARGTSLRNLRLAAERAGLHARSWKLSAADLIEAPMPAIAFINGDHFVVVRRVVDRTSLEVDDPALGRLHWPLKAFCSRWSGETLIFDGAWQPDNTIASQPRITVIVPRYGTMNRRKS